MKTKSKFKIVIAGTYPWFYRYVPACCCLPSNFDILTAGRDMYSSVHNFFCRPPISTFYIPLESSLTYLKLFWHALFQTRHLTKWKLGLKLQHLRSSHFQPILCIFLLVISASSRAFQSFPELNLNFSSLLSFVKSYQSS